MENIEAKVADIDRRVTVIETQQPFLKDILERNTASYEKMSGVVEEIKDTLIVINHKVDSQSAQISSMREDISSLESKTDKMDEMNKFNISEWIKKNLPWIIICVGLGIAYASQYVKF